MDTMINYWAVIGGGIFLMVAGAVWYGPIFGRQWMKIIGAAHMTGDEMEKTQKEMIPMYIIQFMVSLLTSHVLYYFVKASGLGVILSLLVWLGFAMPMAAGAMWDTKKGLRMKKFLIVAGYQFTTLCVLGFAFTMW